MIALILALHHGIIICYGAFFEAYDDFKEIGVHKPIYHRAQWLLRLAVALIVTGGATYALTRHGVDVRIGLPLTLASWPLFSLPFRLSLNKLRKLDWRYLGEDAWYDQGFLMLGHLIAASLVYTGSWKLLSGLIAALFELMIYAIACWWMVQVIG